MLVRSSKYLTDISEVTVTLPTVQKVITSWFVIFIASDNPGPLLVIHWPDSNYTIILRIKNKCRNVDNRQSSLL